MPSRVEIIHLASPLLRHHFLVTRLLGMQKAKNHEIARLPIRSQMIARQSSKALIRLPLVRNYVGRAYWWAQNPYASQRPRIASAPGHTVLKLLPEKHCSGSLATSSAWEGRKSLTLFSFLLMVFLIPTLTPGFHLEVDFPVDQRCFIFSVLACSVKVYNECTTLCKKC